MPRLRAPEPLKKRKLLPRKHGARRDRARGVGAGDKVRMTFRVVLPRQAAEALPARAIREEKNIGALVIEILEAAPAKP